MKTCSTAARVTMAINDFGDWLRPSLAVRVNGRVQNIYCTVCRVEFEMVSIIRSEIGSLEIISYSVADLKPSFFNKKNYRPRMEKLIVPAFLVCFAFWKLIDLVFMICKHGFIIIGFRQHQ
jgi:hypothetical protein